jgi:hypothetical protein
VLVLVLVLVGVVEGGAAEIAVLSLGLLAIVLIVNLLLAFFDVVADKLSVSD